MSALTAKTQRTPRNPTSKNEEADHVHVHVNVNVHDNVYVNVEVDVL